MHQVCAVRSLFSSGTTIEMEGCFDMEFKSFENKELKVVKLLKDFRFVSGELQINHFILLAYPIDFKTAREAL